MENMDKSNASGNYSIVQKILNETSNPKLAAVLALDLLLVGVDTVRNNDESFCIYRIAF